MHDPMTVAFDIKSPIQRVRKGWPEGYRETLVTIWHRDPEHGGDDDSCGWCYPNLSKSDVQWCENFAKNEWKFWFGPEFHNINLLHADDVPVLSQVWTRVRHLRSKNDYPGALKASDVGHVLGLLGSPGDNFRHLILDAKQSIDGFEMLLRMTLRYHGKVTRPWYRHPKWHIHHWRVQVHGWQKFNRWAFSRCAGCGKRFAWGYAPVSHQWHSDGPRFLKGEKNKFHHECSGYTTTGTGAG